MATTTILIIGASGDVGKAATAALKAAFAKDAATTKFLIGGRSDGVDVKIDVSDSASIKAALAPFVNATSDEGKLSHIICTGGQAVFKPLSALTKDDLLTAFSSKALGQMDLVLQGQNAIKSTGGSITLTTGFLDSVQVPYSVAVGALNSSVNTFVRQAPAELKPGVRVNSVSPGMLESSKDKYGAYFAGFSGCSDEHVGNAFVRSVLGGVTGKVLLVLPGQQWQES